ncbi:uncharacterized protein At4g00950 [Rhodamnia argentea]|uniref:Uncharacterized protein At4g00950 n=1 Tax=Rhodamnia argentea TaxID=178133 RepID=A0A8B8QPB6_9MYRT|nr:uncharacterized protein At4g00950 [Rhodamnia argentea]
MVSKAVEPGESASTAPGKLLLVSVAPKTAESPDPSGMRTPPFHTTAAVPFRWEEEPGKPRPCSALAIVPSPGPGEPYSATRTCLELPPRLLSEAIIAKMPTPAGGQQTSSFRMGGECYGSFRSYVVAERAGDGDDEEGIDVGATREGVLVRSKPSEWRWWWFGGSSGRRKKREMGGSSYVFPSFSCNYVVGGESSELRSECRSSTNMRRPGSFPLLSYSSHSHFSWATLYGGLKEAIPWRRRSRKAGKMRS